MCTLFCGFYTCVSCITFFLGLAASHSSKDPPSLAYWLFASPQLNSVRLCCRGRAKRENENCGLETHFFSIGSCVLMLSLSCRLMLLLFFFKCSVCWWMKNNFQPTCSFSDFRATWPTRTSNAKYVCDDFLVVSEFSVLFSLKTQKKLGFCLNLFVLGSIGPKPVHTVGNLFLKNVAVEQW